MLCFIEILDETKETANFETFDRALSDLVGLLVPLCFEYLDILEVFSWSHQILDNEDGLHNED
jgi:hypothetical protein